MLASSSRSSCTASSLGAQPLDVGGPPRRREHGVAAVPQPAGRGEADARRATVISTGRPDGFRGCLLAQGWQTVARAGIKLRAGGPLYLTGRHQRPWSRSTPRLV